MKRRGTGDYVGSVIGNIVGILLVNTVLLWRQYTQGVILESWVDILWAVDLSMSVQVIGSLILAVHRPAWLEALVQALFAAVGLVSVIVVWIVFPLDFSVVVGQWLNTLVRGLLVLGMVGSCVSGIVWLVRLSGAEAAGAPGR
jgi:hypothetical protein